MNDETVIQRLIELNAKYEAQWDADVAAVRAQVAEEESLPLRMGDLFNTLKERWGHKMPDLAKEAAPSSLRSCPPTPPASALASRRVSAPTAPFVRADCPTAY